MKDAKSKARMQALKELKDAMSSDMKDGYEKMTVMAPDKSGLEKGLEMGKDILEKMPAKPMKDEEMEMPEEEMMEDGMEMGSEEMMEEEGELPEDEEHMFEMFKEFMKQYKKEM